MFENYCSIQAITGIYFAGILKFHNVPLASHKLKLDRWGQRAAHTLNMERSNGRSNTLMGQYPHSNQRSMAADRKLMSTDKQATQRPVMWQARSVTCDVVYVCLYICWFVCLRNRVPHGWCVTADQY